VDDHTAMHGLNSCCAQARHLGYAVAVAMLTPAAQTRLCVASCVGCEGENLKQTNKEIDTQLHKLAARLQDEI
jgi:hypothetical protein